MKILVLGGLEQVDSGLVDRLEGLGHEISILPEPENCPVYFGKDCPREDACVDAMLLNQQMPAKDALSYVGDLKRYCCGKPENIAIFAALFSPDELVEAIEIGCRVLFKPVLQQEVEGWLTSLTPCVTHRPHQTALQ